MMRVQIPAYTDRWMMGDRFGTLIKTTHLPLSSCERGKLRLGSDLAVCLTPTFSETTRTEIAHVKLDISGKTVRVILDDCTVA